jgi:hypothetical protein
MAALFQQFTLEAARKYGYETAAYENLPVRIVDGEYPIFPGVEIGFSRIQEFWVREQRGDHISANKGNLGYVGGCSAAFRDDFGILANGDVTTCCVDYDGRNVIANLHEKTLLEVLDGSEARRIRRSFQWFIPPTQFCRECRGGPTLGSSLVKQIGTIAVDVKDRIAPRKAYRSMLERVSHGG